MVGTQKARDKYDPGGGGYFHHFFVVLGMINVVPTQELTVLQSTLAITVDDVAPRSEWSAKSTLAAVKARQAAAADEQYVFAISSKTIAPIPLGQDLRKCCNIDVRVRCPANQNVVATLSF